MVFVWFQALFGNTIFLQKIFFLREVKQDHLSNNIFFIFEYFPAFSL